MSVLLVRSLAGRAWFSVLPSPSAVTRTQDVDDGELVSAPRDSAALDLDGGAVGDGVGDELGRRHRLADAANVARAQRIRGAAGDGSRRQDSLGLGCLCALARRHVATELMPTV